MNRRPLVVLTTKLPPAICGVGAYSWELHHHWPNDSAQIEYLVVEGATDSRAALRHERISSFAGSAAKLRRELRRFSGTTLFLHYAGRAFHRFGCPWWMPSVIADWKKSSANNRCVIFYHELPADLPISSRHFFPQRLNRSVVQRLAQQADLLLTNTEHHAAKLKAWLERSDLRWFPVGSNLPSPSPDAVDKRAVSDFVIFGLPFSQLQIVREFKRELIEWRRDRRLQTLHIIGPAEEAPAREADRILSEILEPPVVVRHGALPAGEIPELLTRSLFALTHVSPETWSKSGSFMAAAQHGCATVVRQNRTIDGPWRHTIGADELALLPRAEIDDRRHALQAWYRTNADWPVLSRQISALVDNV